MLPVKLMSKKQASIPVLPRSIKYPTLKGEHWWPEEKKKDRFPILTAKFGNCVERDDLML
jgi:hypothetical protein